MHKVFNSHAFINVHDYDSLEDVAEAVKKIDSDETLYLSMLESPALVSERSSMINMSRELETFLLHIFEQPFGNAQRRTLDALRNSEYRRNLELYRNLSFCQKCIYQVKKCLK